MNAFDQAVHLYDLAESDGDPTLWRQALAAAKYAATVEPDNVEAHYLAGLCAYYADDMPATHEHLRRALDLKPQHAFAGLYLGHQLYDEGRYGEAARQFRSVDPTEFERMGQSWRVLKLDELCLCCRLYTNEAVSAREVKRVVQRYMQTEEDESALPAELVECVCTLDTGSNKSLQSITEMVIAMAEASGMTSAASLLRARNAR